MIVSCERGTRSCHGALQKKTLHFYTRPRLFLNWRSHGCRSGGGKAVVEVFASWANVNFMNDWNAPHSHEGDLSGDDPSQLYYRGWKTKH
jgi:hypothetical protein